MVTPIRKIEEDIIKLQKRINKAEKLYIVRCFCHIPNNCYMCDNRGFIVYLWKPETIPKEIWKRNLISIIPRKYAADIEHIYSLRSLIEFLRSIKAIYNERGI